MSSNWTDDRSLTGADDVGRRPAEAFVRSSGPFTDIQCIGEGGMGLVYKAVDTRLQRTVALKILRSDDPRESERLLREARLQARVDHPNVCRIYDVDAFLGRPCIAMQYIGGPSLIEARHRMSLRDRLTVMRDVAEAVDAAHQRGLVHRDLKPANIRLEISERRDWTPYVLDFGLARDLAAPRLTSTDVLAGTPQYLSPEQIRGESADAVTDVYGLGATCYELLTGQAPFSGNSVAEILMRIVDAEPRRLREIDALIPRDVENVVLKCLEKERSRRYASAADVAADLSRILRGETTHARPAGRMRRLARWTAHHRITAAVTALSLALIAITAGFLLHAEWRARRQQALASAFGQDLAFVERVLNHAYASPLHDIRAEQARARHRLQRVTARIATDATSAGPGHYASGRILLALRDHATALHHLREAWRHGYRHPEVAYALGKAMGFVYEDELKRAGRIPDPELRAKTIGKVQDEFRTRSIEYLQKSQGVQFESPHYLRSLTDYYKGNRSAASISVRHALRDAPWLYEAHLLDARIRIDAAAEHGERGDDFAAIAEYAEAERALRQALTIAPSDPLVLGARCGLAADVVLFRGAISPGNEPLGNALQACAEALAADPAAVAPRLSRANAFIQWSRLLRDRGDDPSAALASAAAEAGKAGRIRPENEWAWHYVGTAQWWRAIDAFRRGDDPRAMLDEAVSAFDRAIRLDPQFSYAYLNLGNAHLLRADYERRHGRDSRPAAAAAVNALQKAAALHRSFVVDNNVAFAHLQAGLYERDIDADPTPSFNAALAAARRAASSNRGAEHPHIVAGTIYWRVAQWRLDQRRIAADALRHGREEITTALTLAPDYWEGHALNGALAVAEARNATLAGSDPRAHFAVADRSFERALELNAKEPWTHQQLAEMYRTRAVWAAGRGRESSMDIDRASRAVEKALALNPIDADSYLIRGSIHLLRRDREATERDFATARAIRPTAWRDIAILRRESERPR